MGRLVAVSVFVSAALLSGCAAQPVTVRSPIPTATPPRTPLDSLAPTPSPVPSRTPVVPVRPGVPPACAGKPVPAGTVIDPCATTTGVVRAVAVNAFFLEPDYGQEQVLGLTDLAQNAGRIRVDVGIGLTGPKMGDHVSAVGPLTVIADGAHALTPAYRVDVLVAQPPSVPPGVLAARAVWAQARAAWPLIAPAIFSEGDITGTAAAALYPDGIARVVVHTDVVPDAHTIWHEAGHIYHASVLRARGHAAALFTPQDEVGLAYWSARRLPGTWAESLATGAWSTTGFEILAETFAAVNLGDSELASTSGVPLDRDAIRSFFRSLGP